MSTLVRFEWLLCLSSLARSLSPSLSLSLSPSLSLSHFLSLSLALSPAPLVHPTGPDD